MRHLLGPVVLLSLLAGLAACVAPAASPSPPTGGQPTDAQPTLLPPSMPRPTGPSSTIEIPPPIK